MGTNILSQDYESRPNRKICCHQKKRVIVLFENTGKASFLTIYLMIESSTESVGPFWNRVSVSYFLQLFLDHNEQQRKYEEDAYQTDQRENSTLIFEFVSDCLTIDKMREVIILPLDLC